MNLRFDNPFEPRTHPTAQTITANDPLGREWVIKEAGGGPFLFVDGVTLPEEVGAGGIIDITLTVVDTSLTIQGEDRCEEGAQAGWQYTTTATGSWGDTDSTTVCHSGTGFRVAETRELSLNAPEQPGEYTIDLSIVTKNQVDSAGASYPISVVEDGDRRPDDDPIDQPPEDSLPIIGGGINQGLVILVLLLLLLLVVGLALP